MSTLGIMWTREAVIEAAGFEPVKDVKRVRKVYVEATSAMTRDGEPDHPTRIRGAERLGAIYGLDAPKRDEAPDSGRPISVNIILAESRPVLHANGVRLHLNGDPGTNGH